MAFTGSSKARASREEVFLIFSRGGGWIEGPRLRSFALTLTSFVALAIVVAVALLVPP